MIGFLKTRWVLLAGICVFVLLKLPHLSYPYYWDESWPYASAIRAMHDHGISLLPGAVDSDLSRGHPLFFHALAAGWMKVFGAGHVAMHSFALVISVLFLICIYEAGFRIFSQRVGVLAFVLVATQEVFFMQSSYVLLEVLVSFLCFLSLWSYAKGRYALTALFLTLLFYTKESGVVLGLVLGLDALVALFRRGGDKKDAVRRLLTVAVPCALTAVFFLLQKELRGWYIFPFHAEVIEHSWKAIWYKVRMNCISDVFYRNQKFWYYLLLLLLAIVAAIKNRRWKYLVLLLPVVMIFYMVDDMRAGRILPPVPFTLVFIAAWFWLLQVFGSAAVLKEVSQRRFFVLGGCFILCFLWFSAVNYYTFRYMLAVLVPALFLLAVLFDVLLNATYRVAYYVLFPVVAVVSYAAFATNGQIKDTDMGALSAMAVQEDVVGYLEQEQLYDKTISLTCFVASKHLTDYATGFLHYYDRRFSKVQWEINSNTDVVLFDNIEPDTRYEQVKNDTSFRLMHRYTNGSVWNEVYMRKR
jgi:4-amino-4-deoxy-L-arabinose transferase-like glycosyltransferase